MLTGRVYYGGTELTRILLFITLQCCIMAELGVCVPSNNSVSQASPNRRELHMKNSFPLSTPQPRHVTVYKVIHRKALKKKTPLHNKQPFGATAFLSPPHCRALPVHVFLPVIWGWRGICIRASKHDVPLTLVHHTACLLVVIERHRRGRHRLDIDGDICFTVRKKIML